MAGSGVEDTVLQRVLLPSHTPLCDVDGTPFSTYHVVISLRDKKAGRGWHAAEAVELVGQEYAQGPLLSSGNVLLDTGRCNLNLQLDHHYIRTLQQQAKAAAMTASAVSAASATVAAAATVAKSSYASLGNTLPPMIGGANPTASMPPPPPAPLPPALAPPPPLPWPAPPSPFVMSPEGQQQQQQQAVQQWPARNAQALLQPVAGPMGQTQRFELVVHCSRVHSAVSPFVSGGGAGREIVVVMQGSLSSSHSTPLNKASAVSRTGTPQPFTSPDNPDTFQLSCTPAVGAVLRLEVSLPSSSDQSWGVLLDKIDVRDRATGAVTEFPCGAWLGRSPDSSERGSGGSQMLLLLPAGVFAYTFMARPVGTVRALHLRHDNPGLWPGWDVEAIDVFVVPAAAAAAAAQEACIAMYRAAKPLEHGCPIDTPNRSVDKDIEDRARAAADPSARHVQPPASASD
ncbi:MAG: hypothetical protein WDW38_005785 [Sanguina aurantia]